MERIPYSIDARVNIRSLDDIPNSRDISYDTDSSKQIPIQLFPSESGARYKNKTEKEIKLIMTKSGQRNRVGRVEIWLENGQKRPLWFTKEINRKFQTRTLLKQFLSTSQPTDQFDFLCLSNRFDPLKLDQQRIINRHDIPFTRSSKSTGFKSTRFWSESWLNNHSTESGSVAFVFNWSINSMNRNHGRCKKENSSLHFTVFHRYNQQHNNTGLDWISRKEKKIK